MNWNRCMTPETPAATDAELIARVRAGEVNAFEPLITRHRQQVLAIAARHVPAAEVAATAQDVFVRAFLSLKSYRAERPFGHWLARIAVRTCCDFWRQQKRL
ncbi:MAG: sigma factor, partial [bacterium]